jgi:hypothetical protein
MHRLPSLFFSFLLFLIFFFFFSYTHRKYSTVMTEDGSTTAQWLSQLPRPPNCSMPTLGETLDFLTDFYRAAERLSVRNYATGETSLVVFGMSLTKPSGKEVILILGANDEEQSRLILEAIATNHLGQKLSYTQNQRSDVQEGNVGGTLGSIVNGDDASLSEKVEGTCRDGRINSLHNPNLVDQKRSNNVFCPPNHATAIRFIEAIYEQCDPIVRMIAPAS